MSGGGGAGRWRRRELWVFRFRGLEFTEWARWGKERVPNVLEMLFASGVVREIMAAS